MEIHIKNLKLKTIIGILDHELEEPQEVCINMCLIFDARAVLGSANIDDTVDYAEVERTVIDCVKRSKSKLLENLAHEIAVTVLMFKQVKTVRIEIDKPSAMEVAESVSIVHEESRGKQAF